MKQIVKVKARQVGCSILSKKSWVMIVVKVLNKPALIPLGGSFVTLSEVCSKPRGKAL